MREIIKNSFRLLKEYNDKDYNTNKFLLYNSVNISEHQHTACKITEDKNTYIGSINKHLIKMYLSRRSITILGLPLPNETTDITYTLNLTLALMQKYKCWLYISQFEYDLIKKTGVVFRTVTSLQGSNDNDHYDIIHKKLPTFYSSKYRNKRLGGFLNNNLELKDGNCISFRLLEGEKCEIELYKNWSLDKGSKMVRENVYEGLFKNRNLFTGYGLFVDGELVQSMYLTEIADGIWYMYAKFGVRSTSRKEYRYSGNILKCLVYKELSKISADRLYVDGGYDNPETGEELQKHKDNNYDLIENRYLVSL